MKSGIRCFAGCNTGAGFHSGFEGIFASRARTFFIKGAPGAGKSGLMTRIAERQTAMNHPVSRFYCSSDPDSLDGIVDEAINAAMLDATAPHTYDPPLPGASGSILSLGDYLNEQALSRDATAIQELNARLSAAFREAQSYLAAAAHVKKAIEVLPFEGAVIACADEIIHSLPKRGSIGAVRRYFLTAHTCKGFISFLDQFPPSSTISIPAPFPRNATPLFERICREARCMGLEAILFLNPVNPEIIDHMYLPDIPLFLTTEPVRGAMRVISGLFDDCSNSFEEALPLYEALTGQAEKALARAKALHDELEGFYSPRMDFSHLVEAESRVARAFDALNNKK